MKNGSNLVLIVSVLSQIHVRKTRILDYVKYVDWHT